MDLKYDIKKIEEKWQRYWEQHPLSKIESSEGNKYYCLDMFPYPSGSGLHVGHWRGYVFLIFMLVSNGLKDINVFHPMGLGCLWVACRK